MNENDEDEKAFRKTVDDVHLNIQRIGLKNAEKRDLLIYLGHKVIEMSSREELVCSTEQSMSTDNYQTLLKYSEKLLEIEEKSQRPYLEAFLYYTIFNWPSETRKDIPQLGGPIRLKKVLDKWYEKYNQNFRNLFKKKPMAPKAFLALGNGPIGKDVVDSRSLEREWRRSTGKTRLYVKDDHVWDKEYARQALKRLVGTLNGTGTSILFETKHRYWNYKLDIACRYNSGHLSNRQVSFVLLFSWSGPQATDIRSIEDENSLDDESPSSLESRADQERRPPTKNGKGKAKRGETKGSSHKKTSLKRK